MKAAIEQFLDREEALEAERHLVRERWASYELTGKTVAQADVRARHALEDYFREPAAP
jgi:hypothetical protein